jgi:uncharacterized protein (UPF0335 family)
LKKLYHNDYFKLPLKKKLQKIRERILFLLKSYEEERIREVVDELNDTGSYIDKVEISEKGISRVRDEMKDIYSEIDRITKFDLVDIYKQFIEDMELFSGGSNNNYNEKDIEDELRTIVSMGGRVIDVTIEHKIYGEITGKLMLKSIFDVEHFMKRLNDEGSKPLSQLTEGVHLHTLEADDSNVMDRIINKLKEKGYLLSQEG